MSKMPTSQRWPKPSGPREIGNATGVAAGAGVPEGRLKAVGVTVSVGGWGVAAGTVGVKVRGLVGDGVMSGSTEDSTVSVASLSGEPLVGVVSRGGVGERVTVATFVAVAVLVGELISGVAGVLVGRLIPIGVRVGVTDGVEIGVLVGLGGLVAVGRGG